MDKRSVRRDLCAFALMLLFAAAAPAGVKHDFLRPVFVYALHPDVPISQFASGRIGIPEPQHARIYLFPAFRVLEGKPLTPKEQRMWLKVWKSRAQWEWPSNDDDREWSRVRRKVPVPNAQPSRSRPAVVQLRQFMSSAICTKDALDTAARTLVDRIKRFGVESAEVRFWTEGQDAVFRACRTAEPQHLPPAPAGMHPLIRADRDYQIAAGLLYAQHFDEAAAAFERVARDLHSPWRLWAPYQVGRALLWKARQTQSEETYHQTLAEAEAQFRSVVGDPKLAASHQAAEYLLLRCMLITNPKAAIERMARRLLNGTWRETDLALYLTGLDWLDGDPWDYHEHKPVPRVQLPADSLSQWILGFQRDSGGRRAANVWKRTNSRAWLYAALWGANAKSSDELAKVALAAGINENGGPALLYVAARNLTMRGRFDEARTVIDQVIGRLDQSPSSRNRALQLRTVLAADKTDFLKLVPRTVVYAGSESDSDEWQSQDEPDLQGIDYQLPKFRAEMRRSAIKHAAEQKKLASLPRIDDSTADIFNERLPLGTLAEMAQNPVLPIHLRNELVVVAWTRAILLNRLDFARRLGPAFASTVPGSGEVMRRFLESPSDQTAACVLVQLPGARPYVSRGYGRGMPITQHDEFGRNWWFRFNQDEMHDLDLPYRSGTVFSKPIQPLALPQTLPFVSREEESEAAGERAMLQKSGENGLNWIAVRITSAVRAHPNRPDAAELLFHILNGSRIGWWGERPDHGRPVPGIREAHQMLSSRYRSTRWFRKYQQIESPLIPARIP